MKKLFTFFALALFSAIGLGGGNVALAATVETYDFAAFVAGGAPTLTLTSTEVKQEGTNAKTLYVVGDQTNTNGTNLNLKRIALCSHPKSNITMRWMWRSNSDRNKAYQNGLAGNWNKNGSEVTSFNISILKLYQGDKVTITYAIQSGKSAQIHVCSSGVLTGLEEGGTITSNTTYTVAKDGNLDMYVLNNNMAIQKIVIESDKVAESVEAPTMSVVGAYNGDRIVEIASKKTNNNNPTTTYFTLDGSDPTTSSTVYSGNITISSTDSPGSDGKVLVKALTVKNDDASVKSEIKQLLVENLGTTVQLNAPSYYISMQPKGNYVAPQYGFSSNQSDVVGNPSVSYFYQVNGGDEKAGSSFTPTAKCSLTIIARSEGYAENSTTIDINAYLLKKVKDYDFTAFKEHSEETVGDMKLINGKGCQAYALATDAIENITLDNITLMWAVTANKALGLYARTDAGKVTYNGAFPEGSVILYKDIDDASYLSTSNVLNIAQYGSVKSMEVYNALTDEELEEWEKIQNSFIPVDGPTYDPDKAPEGGIESATRPEHGMATSPSDTTQNDNTNGTATGINGAEAEAQIVSIVNVNGAKVNSLQKGINIVTYSNGKRVKIMK